MSYALPYVHCLKIQNNKVLTLVPFSCNHINSQGMLFLTLVEKGMVCSKISRTTDKIK